MAAADHVIQDGGHAIDVCATYGEVCAIGVPGFRGFEFEVVQSDHCTGYEANRYRDVVFVLTVGHDGVRRVETLDG